ncbi:MAG: ATP-binding protein [Actinomycetes bacterium]|jgi:predicted AAA+ superfamily ATPase|nr:ATP-binding protein [Actinomycetes bacterium]
MNTSGYIERNLAGSAREILDYFPVLVIQGARQAGKSTFAENLIEGSPQAKFVSFDDEATRAAFLRDSLLFLNQADSTLVIDEVQRLPEALLAIKSSVDNDRRPGRFILTGSSNLLDLKGAPDSLAGRAATLELRGFSQGELAGRKEDFFAAAQKENYQFSEYATAINRDGYLDLFLQGQYPVVRDYPARMRSTWYTNYMRQLFQKDIADINTRISSNLLNSLFGLLAANQAGEMVKGRYAQQLGISPRTCAEYYAVLKTMYLVSDLPSWSNNLTTRQVARSKCVIGDTALVLQKTRTGRNQLADLLQPTILGAATEGFVITELLRQKTWSELDYELYHYRDRLGNEVDCIVEFADGRIILIEIKSSTTYSGQQFKGIDYLAKKLGDRFVAGFVLGMAPNAYQYACNIWGLPIAALWEYDSR